jgi:hypothetical protein
VTALADDLVAVLATEPIGLSCDGLARRLRRRRNDVLDVLRSDGRFEHGGCTRGSRWRVVGETVVVARRDGMCRDERGDRGHRVGHDGRGALGA